MLTKKSLFIEFLILIVLFTSCNASEKNTESEPPIQSEKTSISEPIQKKVATSPAVILRDDLALFEVKDSTVLDTITSLDMGTEVTYLGEDKELQYGKNTYTCSKITTSDGDIGWVYKVRLAKNTVNAVVVEESRLYNKPTFTAPISRTIPAGQIVAISIDIGKTNAFAQITFSYYDENGLSYPETTFIPYDCLSAQPVDIDVAKLVLKAFTNSEQQNDFFNLAFSLESVFLSQITTDEPFRVFAEPETTLEPDKTASYASLLAINPLKNGESLPFVLGRFDDNTLGWISAEKVSITPSLREKILTRPAIENKTTYTGTGAESVCLYQGLSLRGETQNDIGESILEKRLSILELGEVVYAQPKEMTYDNINFIFIDFPTGIEGWSSSNYIAQDAKPAVIINHNVPIFTEPKLTALSTLKLNNFQIIAVHNETEKGFQKISFVSQDNDRLYREVYAKLTELEVSYNKDDINATLLLTKYKKETDEKQKNVLLEEISKIDSFFSNNLDTIINKPEENTNIDL